MGDEMPVGYALVASYADVYEDDNEAALRLLEDLRCSRRAVSALLPILEDAVGHARRVPARKLERRARRAFRGDGGSGVTHDVLQARKDLMELTFALGDGTRVLFGEATVEQHRERIAMLRRNARGIEVTIAVHEDAVAAIGAAGVSCLNEIRDAA